MADFVLNLREAFGGVKAKVDEVFFKSVLEADARIMQRTPVDTGRLRGNWHLTEGSPATGTLELGTPGNSIPPPGARILYLVNNLPYARRIEYGFTGQDSLGRSYNQSGRGMVGLTVLEWPDIVKAAAASVK